MEIYLFKSSIALSRLLLLHFLHPLPWKYDSKLKSGILPSSIPLLYSQDYSKRYSTRGSTILTQSPPKTSPPPYKSSDNSQNESLQRKLRRDLSNLRDPLKLAAYVNSQLAAGRENDALAMVRFASRSHQYVVSWNNLIDWQLKSGKVSKALKLWTDMKRRGQHPDSHTYCIILRGFARLKPLLPSQVDRAVHVYESMLRRVNSRVQPLILHANALLNIFLIARDAEKFWKYVHSLPSHGPLSPDKITYNIIFQFLRLSAREIPLKQLPPTPSAPPPFHRNAHTIAQLERSPHLLQQVTTARKLWKDILFKCKSGSLSIDEMLLASYARVLLLTPQSTWEIFPLILLTTGIPLYPHLHLSRHSSQNIPREPPFNESPKTHPFKFLATTWSNPRNSSKPSSTLLTLNPIQPTNRSLSILLSACHRLHLKNAALYYFELFYNRFKEIDNANWTFLYRILRINPSDESAVRLIRQKLCHSAKS